MHALSSVSEVIRDWSDGFITLKHRAEDVRGAVESDLNTGERQRWPRTSCAEVLAVAAFFDPCVRALVARGDFGSAALDRSWRACLQDLERWATQRLDEEYLENRRFWSDVLTAAVHLSAASSRLPSQRQWDALLASIGSPARNGLPEQIPFGPFPGAQDYSDVFVGQRKHFMQLRGVDRLPPEPGMTGGIQPIPRTTYADLLPLVAFWSLRLKSVQKTFAHDAVARQWDGAVTELATLIKGADSSTAYPKNQSFWRALARVATLMTVADGAPSKTQRILDSLAHGVREAPSAIATAATTAAKSTLEVASEVADGAGKVAGGLVRGVFSGAGMPLLIGGGVLGAVLLLRGRRERGEV